MNLEKQWEDGMERVSAELSSLPEPQAEMLSSLCRSMMDVKLALHALTGRVDPASHCAGCGGACCVAGKYHFSRVDLLAYLVTGEPLFEPLFDNGLCPYLAQGGCLMPPAYRPFNCITFNCELIEDLLSPDEVSRFYAMERGLRESYAAIRALFPEKRMDGALLAGAA